MRVLVKARHGHVNDSVRSYAEEKLGKLARRVHDLTVIEVTLSRERNIVVREHASTWEAAIDRLIDKLERQVERQRDMKTHERRRRSVREQAVSEDDLEAAAADLGGTEESAA
jgi:ribosome-associated translation inhibitor RaiA